MPADADSSTASLRELVPSLRKMPVAWFMRRIGFATSTPATVLVMTEAVGVVPDDHCHLAEPSQELRPR
jgi:hypothetical protein